jgi:hypothetical protein
MRATVGLLNRNIKITHEGSQGYGIHIDNYNDESGNIQIGSAVLQGVRIVKGGKATQTSAAVTIKDTYYDLIFKKTKITSSSF